MVEQGDDQLMHFKWKDRTSGNIEDDLIIFPDDVEFKKVNQCTTGRVFLLKFKSTTRKLFFWMQEPKSDKDEEFCKKVNDYLNNPPAPGSSSGGGSGSRGGSGGSGGIPGLDLSNLGDSELQSLLNNMSQSQLMQLFGGGGSAITGGAGGLGSTRQRSNAGGNNSSSTVSSASSSTGSSTTTTTTTTTATSGSAATAKPTGDTSSANIRLSDLQNVLSGLPTSATGEFFYIFQNLIYPPNSHSKNLNFDQIHIFKTLFSWVFSCFSCLFTSAVYLHLQLTAL